MAFPALLVFILASLGQAEECPFKLDESPALHLLQRKASASDGDNAFDGSLPIGCSDIYMQSQLQREFFIKVGFKTKGGMQSRQMLLDSGSASVALCPNTVHEIEADPAGYVSCNVYGQKDKPAGYAGHILQGDTHLGDLRLRSRYFSIMKYESQMPCHSGYQGIYGIGPVQGKLAYEADGFTDLYDVKSALDWCKHNATLVGWAASTQVKELREAPIGIFWSGHVGGDVGNIYFGAAARQNPHFAGRVLKTPLSPAGGHWMIQVTQVVVGHTVVKADPDLLEVGFGFNGAIDTGSSETTVPNTAFDALQTSQSGFLEVHLKNAQGGADIVLTLGDKDEDTPELYLQPLQTGLPFILGKLLFKHYYVVADVKAKTVEFVAN